MSNAMQYKSMSLSETNFSSTSGNDSWEDRKGIIEYIESIILFKYWIFTNCKVIFNLK